MGNENSAFLIERTKRLTRRRFNDNYLDRRDYYYDYGSHPIGLQVSHQFQDSCISDESAPNSSMMGHNNGGTGQCNNLIYKAILNNQPLQQPLSQLQYQQVNQHRVFQITPSNMAEIKQLANSLKKEHLLNMTYKKINRQLSEIRQSLFFAGDLSLVALQIQLSSSFLQDVSNFDAVEGGLTPKKISILKQGYLSRINFQNIAKDFRFNKKLRMQLQAAAAVAKGKEAECSTQICGCTGSDRQQIVSIFMSTPSSVQQQQQSSPNLPSNFSSQQSSKIIQSSVYQQLQQQQQQAQKTSGKSEEVAVTSTLARSSQNLDQSLLQQGGGKPYSLKAVQSELEDIKYREELEKDLLEDAEDDLFMQHITSQVKEVQPSFTEITQSSPGQDIQYSGTDSTQHDQLLQQSFSYKPLVDYNSALQSSRLSQQSMYKQKRNELKATIMQNELQQQQLPQQQIILQEQQANVTGNFIVQQQNFQQQLSLVKEESNEQESQDFQGSNALQQQQQKTLSAKIKQFKEQAQLSYKQTLPTMQSESNRQMAFLPSAQQLQQQQQPIATQKQLSSSLNSSELNSQKPALGELNSYSQMHNNKFQMQIQKQLQKLKSSSKNKQVSPAQKKLTTSSNVIISQQPTVKNQENADNNIVIQQKDKLKKKVGKEISTKGAGTIVVVEKSQSKYKQEREKLQLKQKLLKQQQLQQQQQMNSEVKLDQKEPISISNEYDNAQVKYMEIDLQAQNQKRQQKRIQAGASQSPLFQQLQPTINQFQQLAINKDQFQLPASNNQGPSADQQLPAQSPSTTRNSRSDQSNMLQPVVYEEQILKERNQVAQQQFQQENSELGIQTLDQQTQLWAATTIMSNKESNLEQPQESDREKLNPPLQQQLHQEVDDIEETNQVEKTSQQGSLNVEDFETYTEPQNQQLLKQESRLEVNSSTLQNTANFGLTNSEEEIDIHKLVNAVDEEEEDVNTLNEQTKKNTKKLEKIKENSSDSEEVLKQQLEEQKVEKRGAITLRRSSDELHPPSLQELDSSQNIKTKEHAPQEPPQFNIEELYMQSQGTPRQRQQLQQIEDASGNNSNIYTLQIDNNEGRNGEPNANDNIDVIDIFQFPDYNESDQKGKESVSDDQNSNQSEDEQQLGNQQKQNL